MLLGKDENEARERKPRLHGTPQPQVLVLLLTHTFIPGVKQFCQRSCGPLSFDSFCSLLVLSKFTEDPCSYSLDVFNGRIKQLRRNAQKPN